MNVNELKDVSLAKMNTFNIDEKAERLVIIKNENDIPQVVKTLNGKTFKILSGGSNILLTKAQSDTIIKIELEGITMLEENKDHVWIQVAAGENWNDFVMYCVDNNYCGLENLSLIPGNVGAAPIQNIGGYGVECGELIDSVHYFSIPEKSFTSLKAADCHFGYRDSIFKNELKGKIIITSVVFRLNKSPKLNINYGNIMQELQQLGKADYTIKDVSNAVIKIRRSKLPDPTVLGNSGSFFKNPVISTDHFNKLQHQYPDIPHFAATNGIKIPAAWLIEQCGWKGYRNGDAGVHILQPLVLVNYGDAKGSEIYALSNQIIQSVQEKFGIEMEREVQIW